jgi:hypothetical protein
VLGSLFYVFLQKSRQVVMQWEVELQQDRQEEWPETQREVLAE